jgi:hypothetical protein
MVFDIGLLNVFGVYIGFERAPGETFAAAAETDCLLFEWRLEDLVTLGVARAPALAAF